MRAHTGHLSGGLGLTTQCRFKTRHRGPDALRIAAGVGQTKNVLVHKFVCLGTLEERIDAMIEEKKALAERVIGGGENWLTEVSTATLRQMVTLRPV